ncbi:ABC transporter permease [Nocardia sp. NBC_00565]|uniref:ABC transporter permease n=1 Tax=Nocardia sp. NBC_00565 TaxID=2975993 RepID=UPI002E812EA8|nr:ABC transporter permease [Nocardia sp. NBC_00565]WUC00669.1 ABC transporter permease [Nocardia sp. NBC_00565]
MIAILPPDLVPAVNSEIRKVTTLRASRLLAAFIPAIALVASTVTALLAGPADPKSNPATGAATIGLYIGLAVAIVLAGAFGAAGAGAEYRYATMPLTALFTADRDRLTAAKFLVTAGSALATTFVVELIAFACLLGFGHGKFDFGLRLLAVFGGGLLAAVCWSLIGAGLGLLLRTPTAAIAAMLGWLVIIEPLIWVVAKAVGMAGFATVLPGSATVSTVAVGSFKDSDFLAPTPAAIVVLTLWTLGIGGSAWWLLRKRL